MRSFTTAFAVTALCAAAAQAHLKQGSLSIKGGETFSVGQKVMVTFIQTLGHNDGRYDFYFSKNGGANWSEFAARWQGPKGDGDTVKYEWTVPNSPTTTGQWRACQLAGGECTDANYILKSGNFTIVAGTAVRQAAGHEATALEFDAATGNLRVAFDLSAPARVVLEAFDAQGRLAASLLDGEHPAGSHSLSLFSNRLSALHGKALLRLTLGGESVSRAVELP